MPMRINRAIGLGIAILVLQWFAGTVWNSIERTIAAAAIFTEASFGAVSVEEYTFSLPSTAGE